MNKKLITLYVIFVVYSLFSLTAAREVTIDIYSLFTFEGDLLLVMIFNMLGVFPIYYLLVALRYEKQKFYVYLLFSLGFMFGAFAILPGLMLLKGQRQALTRRKQWLFIVLSFILLIMLFVGILFGDITNYFTLFLNDQFVHIMTIDLVVLLLIPYLDGVFSSPFVHLVKWQL